MPGRWGVMSWGEVTCAHYQHHDCPRKNATWDVCNPRCEFYENIRVAQDELKKAMFSGGRE